MECKGYVLDKVHGDRKSARATALPTKLEFNYSKETRRRNAKNKDGLLREVVSAEDQMVFDDCWQSKASPCTVISE